MQNDRPFEQGIRKGCDAQEETHMEGLKSGGMRIYEELDKRLLTQFPVHSLVQA